MEPRIAIIGAGISGIAAASCLQTAGFLNYKVFEALDRLGGRIETQYFKESDGTPYKLEFGAEWIHGIENNPVYNIATTHNLFEPLCNKHEVGSIPSPWISSANNNRVAKLCSNTTIVSTVHADIENLVKIALEDCRRLSETHVNDNNINSTSVGDIIKNAFDKELKHRQVSDQELWQSIFEQELNALNFYEACESLQDVTLKGYHLYDELDGEEPKLPRGTVTVIEALAKQIPSDNIKFNCPVTNIRYDVEGKQDKVIITTPSSSELFDCVIVTSSVGVLQTMHDTMFSPPLPAEKLTALQHLRLGVVNKVYLEFEHFDFIPSNVDRLELFWFAEDRQHLPDWTWKIAVVDVVLEKPGRNMLVVWFVGYGAKKLESLTDGEIKDGMIKVLRRFLKNSNVPVPKSVLRSTWFTNPYTRGSYSYNGHGTRLYDRDCLAEPLIHIVTKKPVVLFAGEATNQQYYSTIHGAFLTGQREANRIFTNWPKADNMKEQNSSSSVKHNSRY